MGERIARRLTPMWPVRLVKFPRTYPVVSISFDDFPKSAWTTGGQILEDAGIRGTYYVSAAFSPERLGQETPFGVTEGVRYYDLQDLVNAHDRGHELGCHTFSHQRVNRLSSAALVESIQRNAEFVRKVVGDVSFQSFAYPQGAVDVRTKRLSASHFTTCRGTNPGLNSGWIDLAQLKAIALDDRFAPEFELPPLLDRLERRGGWLIFYAHDIDASPSRWGCTPEVLDKVVQMVRARGVDVETVGQVFEKLVGR